MAKQQYVTIDHQWVPVGGGNGGGTGSGGATVIVQPDPPSPVGMPDGILWVDEDSEVPPYEGGEGLTQEEADDLYVARTGDTSAEYLNVISLQANNGIAMGIEEVLIAPESAGVGGTYIHSAHLDLASTHEATLAGDEVSVEGSAGKFFTADTRIGLEAYDGNEIRILTWEGVVSIEGAGVSLSSDNPIRVTKANGITAQRIENLAAPVNPTDGANKAYVDASGGLQTRATASVTTASLAAGASEQGTIQLAAGYRLYRITTSAPARVRIYTTAAKLTADASRPSGTDPIGDHGLVLDYTTVVGTLSADLSPVVDGFDGKATPDGAVPISTTNTGAGAAAITASFIWLRSEQ